MSMRPDYTQFLCENKENCKSRSISLFEFGYPFCIFCSTLNPWKMRRKYTRQKKKRHIGFFLSIWFSLKFTIICLWTLITNEIKFRVTDNLCFLSHFKRSFLLTEKRGDPICTINQETTKMNQNCIQSYLWCLIA